jgi:acyl carrier protein
MIFVKWAGFRTQSEDRYPAMSIRSTIVSHILRIADQQRKTIAPLTDNLVLVDSGLDSLCFAVLVASLDDSLDVYPFSENDDIRLPVTLGDFVKLYENAAT